MYLYEKKHVKHRNIHKRELEASHRYKREKKNEVREGRGGG
jgi:hypothetical protein